MTTPKIIKTKETPNVDSFKLEDHQKEPDAEFPVNTDADRPVFIPPVPEKPIPVKATAKKPAAKPDAKVKTEKPVVTESNLENGTITHISTEHTVTGKRG